jgi:uncharacterized protein RhaS with RHS repeats
MAEQYTSPDPIGLLGGLRPQAYPPNPTNRVDQFGLRMKQNAAQGRRFEQRVLNYIQSIQNKVQSQVTIRPYLDDQGNLANYTVPVDAIGQDASGNIQLSDFKSSDTAGSALAGVQRLFDKGELSAKRAVVLEARHKAPNGNAYGIVMDTARQLTKFFQTESSTGPAEE